MSIVKNLGGAKRSFRLQAENLKSKIKTDVEIVGRKAELRAKQYAPVDLGKLRQNIFYEATNKGFGARLTANVEYAAFQEFGTGGLVDIPKGFENVAKQFHTGNGKMSMKAQPYLIPAAKEGFQDLLKRLKKYERRK